MILLRSNSTRASQMCPTNHKSGLVRNALCSPTLGHLAQIWAQKNGPHIVEAVDEGRLGCGEGSAPIARGNVAQDRVRSVASRGILTAEEPTAGNTATPDQHRGVGADVGVVTGTDASGARVAIGVRVEAIHAARHSPRLVAMSSSLSKYVLPTNSRAARRVLNAHTSRVSVSL